MRGVSLSVSKGEFVALHGPSGCGKSTLLLAAGGLLKPDAGSVKINGQDLYALNNSRRAQFRAGHLGFVFQQFHLVPYLDVLGNVMVTEIATGTTAFGRIRPNKEMFTDHVRQYSGQTFSGDFIPAGNNGAILSFDENITDPRIDETYIYNSYIQTNNGSEKKLFPIRNKGNDAYAQLKKYKDLTYDGTTTIKNIILLRYADILLSRAEVENEINGPVAAYGYVNQVLLRARTTSSGSTIQPEDWDATNVPTQADFHERIMKEREYELNGEGHEWFDMRRHGLGRFQEQVDHHNAAVDFYGSVNNKDFIFENIGVEMKIPIPLAEISGNNLINE